jgi:hypothetical protein
MTFKIHTALPVRFCQRAPRSTLCCRSLAATKRKSSSSSALPTMPSYSETVGTGTRINAQPNFDYVTQRVRSTITMVVILKPLEKNDRFTNMCNIMHAYFHPSTRQEYPYKSAFGQKQAPFYDKFNCCIKHPTVHETIYCQAVTANLDYLNCYMKCT